jgi:hypothetical protein
MLEVQARWNLTMLQAQRSFDQSSQTGSCFEMTNVALDRPDNAVAAGLLCRTINLPDGGSLDWIAHRSPGPVRLHELYALRPNIGESQSSENVCFLRGPVWN